MSLGESNLGEATLGEGAVVVGGATVVSGGLATEANTALAGAVIVAVLVSGGLALETDSALAGTVSTGTIVTGGLATETDTALAGSTTVSVVVAGGLATETDTALAGSVVSPSAVAGGLATETDTALAGTVVEGEVDPFDCIDLNTAVVAYSSATIVGGEIVSGTNDWATFALPTPVLEADKQYDIRVSLEGGDLASGTSSHRLLQLALGSNVSNSAAVESALGNLHRLVEDFDVKADPFTETYRVGSGVAGVDPGDFDTAVASRPYLFISAPRNSTVTAVCWVEVEVPPEVVEPDPLETDQDLVDVDEPDQAALEEEWHVFPTVTFPPLLAPDTPGESWDVALSYLVPADPTGPDPIAPNSEFREPRHRQVLVMGNEVFQIGSQVQLDQYQLLQPFSYGPAKVTFDRSVLHPYYTNLDAVDYIEDGRRVVVLRYDAAGTTLLGVDYRGRVDNWDISTGKVVVTIGGAFTGPAARKLRPQPLDWRVEDLSYWLYAAFRRNRMNLPQGADSGIPLPTRGADGQPYVDYTRELVSLGVKRDGSEWTVWYDEDAMHWAQGWKDTTTVDATFYLSDRMDPQLTRDFTQEYDEVYVTCELDNGLLIRNAVYPNLMFVDNPPGHPFGGVPFGEGTTDEDTTSGRGVTQLIFRLIAMGFLKRRDVAGGFDADVANAVWSARVEADMLNGDPSDFDVDEDLWDWIWEVGQNGTASTKEARILPLVQRHVVRQHFRGPSGNILGANPDFDPAQAAVTTSLHLNLGRVRSKAHAKRLVKRYIETTPNWAGTITIPEGMGLIPGTHVPGTPITSMMHREAIRPGMNLWEPHFDGGTLFHVSTATRNGGPLTLAIDTRARDSLMIDGILKRWRERLNNPAKTYAVTRASHQSRDTVYGHDEHFGYLGMEVEVPGGQWTVFATAGGDYGTIGVVDLLFDSNVEFAVAITKQQTSETFWNNRVPDPLDGGDWWADPDIRDDLDEKEIVYFAGNEKAPCGYWPGRKNGADGEPTGHPITGRWKDEAGVAFRNPGCIFWWAVYTSGEATLQPRYIAQIQRELGA